MFSVYLHERKELQTIATSLFVGYNFAKIYSASNLVHRPSAAYTTSHFARWPSPMGPANTSRGKIAAEPTNFRRRLTIFRHRFLINHTPINGKQLLGLKDSR